MQQQPDGLPIDPDLDPDDPAEPRFLTSTNGVTLPPTSRVQPAILIFIALGGALGTLARAALGQIFVDAPQQFPSTTLIINLVGSFVLGFLVVGFFESRARHRHLRPFLATGVLGGFTTFSTFMVASVQLAHHGKLAFAVLYVMVSLFGGWLAAYFGIVCGKRFVGKRADANAQTSTTGLAQ